MNNFKIKNIQRMVREGDFAPCGRVTIEVPISLDEFETMRESDEDFMGKVDEYYDAELEKDIDKEINNG